MLSETIRNTVALLEKARDDQGYLTFQQIEGFERVASSWSAEAQALEEENERLRHSKTLATLPKGLTAATLTGNVRAVGSAR